MAEVRSGLESAMKRLASCKAELREVLQPTLPQSAYSVGARVILALDHTTAAEISLETLHERMG
jgi:hypothetical protein